MDRRTKNRITEHSRGGHTLVQIQPQGNNIPTTNKITGVQMGLFNCSCGWRGWLDLN